MSEVALELIENYLRENEELLAFEVDVLIDALKLVMNNMFFQFGDLFYRQTTRGQLWAYRRWYWANIYYGLHEMKFLEDSIVTQRLYSYKCFVDDIHGIWIPHEDPETDEQLWQSVVAQPYDDQPLSEILSPNTSQPIGVNRLIIGYRRHQNIGNLLSLRRFDKRLLFSWADACS